MKTLERVDELRELYNFEPVCEWAVFIYVRHLRRWDTDAYFLNEFEAEQHAEELKAHDFMSMVKRCCHETHI